MPQGQPWSDGVLVHPLAGATRSGVEEAVRELSAPERDALRLVAGGGTNEEIGEKVDLSALTEKSHLAHSPRPGTGDRAHPAPRSLRRGAAE
ncbi:LuxR C-terminal-related transcriptional regulator [Modestobacter sp. VKM Ac-2984]|uniref:LuxR C-terminal-related transcriptional regulator n=1 Tax=Modestobacter sp. VKM Ac-2984 TaxID=3004138 RepID=UPI0022AB223B|nr:LuxR C-terminal-related transcriptional regulator [Modestobacter sp. VKM Ac-2984]MCZ2818268.1 LuxR C-terminal-related transcriptional regulator [Modestobacter sp. VKM Ac-2984]